MPQPRASRGSRRPTQRRQSRACRANPRHSRRAIGFSRSARTAPVKEPAAPGERPGVSATSPDSAIPSLPRYPAGPLVPLLSPLAFRLSPAPELVEQHAIRPLAALEAADPEELVRRVELLVVQAEPEADGRRAELALEQLADRNAAAAADAEGRPAVEALQDGGGGHVTGVVGRHAVRLRGAGLRRRGDGHAAR